MKKLATLIILFTTILNLQAQDLSTKKKLDKSSVINVSAIVFKKMLSEHTNTQIIDIRTPQEYKAGHIKGAKLINFYDSNFMKNIEKAELKKEQPIFIYCRSGHRSKASIRFFKELGFKKIVNLAHGINDWYKNEFPVEN